MNYLTGQITNLHFLSSQDFLLYCYICNIPLEAFLFFFLYIYFFSCRLVVTPTHRTAVEFDVTSGAEKIRYLYNHARLAVEMKLFVKVDDFLCNIKSAVEVAARYVL